MNQPTKAQVERVVADLRAPGARDVTSFSGLVIVALADELDRLRVEHAEALALLCSGLLKASDCCDGCDDGETPSPECWDAPALCPVHRLDALIQKMRASVEPVAPALCAKPLPPGGTEIEGRPSR